MHLQIKVHDNFTAEFAAQLGAAATKTENILAEQIKKDTSPFVPFLTGKLDDGTRVIGNQIIYPGPYARYLYHGKVMVDAATGKGPMRIVSKDGTEVIRFKKGATLKPIDKPLDIKKRPGHGQTQDHWLEGSKAQNLDKWIRVAGKAMESDLK